MVEQLAIGRSRTTIAWKDDGIGRGKSRESREVARICLFHSKSTTEDSVIPMDNLAIEIAKRILRCR
jgi:hypothetical protein